MGRQQHQSQSSIFLNEFNLIDKEKKMWFFLSLYLFIYLSVGLWNKKETLNESWNVSCRVTQHISISLIYISLHHTYKPQAEEVFGCRQRDKKPLYGGADHSQTGQGVLTGTRLRPCVRLHRRACLCVYRDTSRDSVCSHRRNGLSARWTYLVGTSLQGIA